MQDLDKYLNSTLKVATILPLVLFLTLKSGRRKIAELPVFDFLVMITLGSMIGADISNPNLKYFPTAYAIILVIGIQYLYSYLKIKSRKFAGVTSFGPTVVIKNGQFLHQNMKRIKFTIENVLMLLREKDIFDVNEVEFAVVEDNGNLSILKKSQYLQVTPKDLNIETKYKGLSVPIIIEGKTCKENLTHLGLDNQWLMEQLKKASFIDEKDVFYAELNTQGELYISKKVNTSETKQDVKIC